MPFTIEGSVIKFHARSAASGVTMTHLPSSRELRKNDGACSFSDNEHRFVWAFDLDGLALVEGDQFVFYSIERRVIGEVVASGHVLENASERPRSHNEIFGGRSINAAIRIPYETVDAIAGYYRATAILPAPPATQRPYTTAIVTPPGQYQVGPCLSTIFAACRGAYEVEDVFVKSVDALSFDPLRADHMPVVGEVAIVLRARHPTHTPRVVGIMLAKDEADVIAEVVAPLAACLERLYFCADDATAAALVASAPHAWAKRVGQTAATDGDRQTLLEIARNDRGDDPRPTWILVVQGDEVYDHDLAAHILFAQGERATVLNAQVATFVLHVSQRHREYDWAQPIAQRLTHYVWDFGEHAGFVDFPWIYYDPSEHMRAFPHGLYPRCEASARPVRRHYPFRTPDQARARITDRLKSGWQPHYANYRDIFMADQAAGRPVKKFWGWFPEAIRTEGIW